MHKPCPSARVSRAFTLIELLMVIAIIAILSSLSLVAFRNGTGSFGPRGGAAVAAGIFSQARSEAILRRVPARVLLDTVYDSANPTRYLRRISIQYATAVDSSGNGTAWGVASKWTLLPANIYIYPNYIVPCGVDANGYSYFEFQPNGQLTTPTATTKVAQFIVAPGRLATTGSPPAFSSLDDNQRYGFFIQRLGRVTFFDDTATIQ